MINYFNGIPCILSHFEILDVYSAQFVQVFLFPKFSNQIFFENFCIRMYSFEIVCHQNLKYRRSLTYATICKYVRPSHDLQRSAQLDTGYLQLSCQSDNISVTEIKLFQIEQFVYYYIIEYKKCLNSFSFACTFLLYPLLLFT